MSLFGRVFHRSRQRSAARRVALDPSVQNYLALAHESVVSGESSRVEAICHEALDLHPESSELIQMARRAARLRLDGRVRELEADLLLAPRPALWSELIEVHMESGRFARAQAAARRWRQAGGSGEALHLESCASMGAFFGGGVREDGQLAWELGQRAVKAMPRDPRPLETLIALSGRVGAHGERRTLLARLLELRPGEPEAEAAFRESTQQGANAPEFAQALLECTRRGVLDVDPPEDQVAANAQPARKGSVRGLLKNIARQEGVHCATYHQGSTALVQGLTGAAADRTARSFRESAHKTRELAARVGLGRLDLLSVEGSHGSLLTSAGKLGIATVWCEHEPTDELTGQLAYLGQQLGGKS
ncbi:MAG: hypothetical protein CMJ86_11120 [Planctomycetes bacterium]|nr:hypothetical protein [Planctomycetota bacterium]